MECFWGSFACTSKCTNTGGNVEAKPGSWKAWLGLGVFAVIAFVVISWDPSYESNDYADDDGSVQEEQLETELYEPEPLAPPLNELERARKYTEQWRQGEYYSESTMVSNWIRAVQNDPDLFDEASGVFSEIQDVADRSTDHLTIMRAYVDLIPVHHAAIDQYLDTFDVWLKAAGAEAQAGAGVHDPEDAFWIFRRAWDASGGDEKLLPKAQEYEQFFEVVIEKEDGFDPKVRYTDEYMMQLAHADVQDPFWCSMLAERLDHLMWLSEVLGHTVKQRQWKTHLADYFMTLHICEDGHPRPEPHRSYSMYRELGMEEDAQNAAWEVVSDAANTFVFGGNPYAPWLDLPKPCNPHQLARLFLWYPRTGLSADEQTQELYAFAKSMEEVGYSDAALKLYDALDEYDEVARLSLVVQENPRPEGQAALEHFFMRLEQAEANKYPPAP